VDGAECGCAAVGMGGMGSLSKERAESDSSRVGSALKDLPLSLLSLPSNLSAPLPSSEHTQREGLGLSGPSELSESEVIDILNDKMVFIKGGLGYMGTDAPFMPRDGESPRRRVRLSPYYLDKYEVSNNGERG
jgi:formylglycine-generating enzyme required for sulfatase activity